MFEVKGSAVMEPLNNATDALTALVRVVTVTVPAPASGADVDRVRIKIVDEDAVEAPRRNPTAGDLPVRDRRRADVEPLLRRIRRRADAAPLHEQRLACNRNVTLQQQRGAVGNDR